MKIPLSGSKSSTLQQLQAVYQATGKKPPELAAFEELECPEELFPFYEDFLQINERRSYQEGFPCPITFVDIDAWARLYKIEPTITQLNVICDLDKVFLKVWAEKHPPKEKK